MSQKIYNMKVSGVYPHYITKAEKKGRTKEEVDEIMRWHTGYSQTELESQLKKEVSFETFLMRRRNLILIGKK